MSLAPVTALIMTWKPPAFKSIQLPILRATFRTNDFNLFFPNSLPSLSASESRSTIGPRKHHRNRILSSEIPDPLTFLIVFLPAWYLMHVFKMSSTSHVPSLAHAGISHSQELAKLAAI